MAKLRNNIHYGSLLSSKNNYFFKILKNVTLLKIEKKMDKTAFSSDEMGNILTKWNLVCSGYVRLFRNLRYTKFFELKETETVCF